jgi:hypothetical protein
MQLARHGHFPDTRDPVHFLNFPGHRPDEFRSGIGQKLRKKKTRCRGLHAVLFVTVPTTSGMATRMHRYFFKFRQGDDIARDRIGMHLADLDAARAEALHAWRHVIAMTSHTGEDPGECEIQIADDSGETVLSIPFGGQWRLH